MYYIMVLVEFVRFVISTTSYFGHIKNILRQITFLSNKLQIKIPLSRTSSLIFRWNHPHLQSCAKCAQYSFPVEKTHFLTFYFILRTSTQSKILLDHLILDSFMFIYHVLLLVFQSELQLGKCGHFNLDLDILLSSMIL